LSVDVVPDSWQQGSISEDELVDEHLQGKSRISCPCEEIWFMSVQGREIWQCAATDSLG